VPEKLEVRVYRVGPRHPALLLGAIPGDYQVLVGDYGWDTGDLYILCPRKMLIRELRDMETREKNG
jgi:hypothetical protein